MKELLQTIQDFDHDIDDLSVLILRATEPDLTEHERFQRCDVLQDALMSRAGDAVELATKIVTKFKEEGYYTM